MWTRRNKSFLSELRFPVFYCPPLPHKFIQSVIHGQFIHYVASISMIIIQHWEGHIETNHDRKKSWPSSIITENHWFVNNKGSIIIFQLHVPVCCYLHLVGCQTVFIFLKFCDVMELIWDRIFRYHRGLQITGFSSTLSIRISLFLNVFNHICIYINRATRGQRPSVSAVSPGGTFWPTN